MSQFNSILVCVQTNSGSVGMLEQAIALAKKHQAAVKLLHVISDYPKDTKEWWNVRHPGKLKKRIIGERQAVLDEMVGIAREQGLENISSELVWGKTFIEISREVMKNKHDLVKITAKHNHKLSRMLLECPSRDLLQHCPCTLWISKGKTGMRPRQVLATLGGTHSDIACDALDVKVLRTAATIAEANGSELHYLHAMPLYGDKGFKKNKLRADLTDYVNTLKKAFIDKCGSVLKEYQVEVNEDRIHMVTGSPEATIVNMVGDNHIDLVIMGARPHKNLQSVLLGTRAMRVLDYLKCDVVGVKPDEFVSLLEREGEVLDVSKAG
ncbi:MAG: universal stress protein [Gammaproteobacteria bacterium]